ncbi:MAG: LysM peptidoglycan-binding domain-containing protein [Desulfobacterales bacterium]
MVFEADENQDGFEEAPRSYLRKKGRNSYGSRKSIWFALTGVAVLILLVGGIMVFLPGSDESSETVSNKKTLEIGDAGDLPEAPSQKGSSGTGTENFTGLESAISEMETKLDENHEQLMGRVAELAKRVVENNEHARESLKRMETLEARIEKLEKQYQGHQLTAGVQSGTGEESAPEGKESEKQKTAKSDTDKSADQYYTVRKNDTMYSIAKKHGIKLETFLKINGLNRDSVIYTGQRLKVSP